MADCLLCLTGAANVDNLRIPPHSIEAESSIIGAILIDDTCLNGVLELIQPENFYQLTHQQIFTCIKELSARKESIDLVTLGDYMDKRYDGHDHISNLAVMARNTPSSANVIAYCRSVVNHWNGRQIIAGCNLALEKCYESSEYEEARTALYDDLEPLFLNQGEELIHDGKMLCDDFTDELERILANGDGLAGMDTGDKHINEVTGGFMPGDYIGLAARSGGGKTTKAMNIMSHMALNGKRVLFFSMEMKRQKVMMKFVSDVANVPFNGIKSAELDDMEWSRLSDAMESIKNSKIHVDDSSGLTIEDIERKARQIKAKYGELDVICIDYIQRIKIDSNRMYQELTNASNRLKDLFMELGCAGMVLAQFKKNSVGFPNASDLRETGAIENDSDALIFLHTPSEDLKPHKGMMTCEIFNKVRFGETGVKMLCNELEFQRFVCSDDDYMEDVQPKGFIG